MTKTKKKEEVIDLSKPEKVNEKQLKDVQNVINEINKTYIDIGNLEAKKHAFVHHIASLQEQVGEMKEEFEKEYGTADIDIQTGTINYPKENGEVNKKD